MRKLFAIPLVVLLVACHAAGPEDSSSRLPGEEVYHDMIQLGEKL